MTFETQAWQPIIRERKGWLPTFQFLALFGFIVFVVSMIFRFGVGLPMFDFAMMFGLIFWAVGGTGALIIRKRHKPQREDSISWL